MSETESPVLVVGGGVVGLSAALFLAWHDVPCVLVERHPELLIHPRARGLTPRTMELYRQVGLEQAIRHAAYAGDDFTWSPVLADTLNDEVYQQPDEPRVDDGAGVSPCSFGPIDQDRLEILIRDEASRLGAELRFHTELTSFEQTSEGVTAVVRDRDTGAERTVHAGYLVAADGANSPIRQRLGIAVDGPGSLFHTITAIIEADLTPAVRGRSVSIAYLQKPQPFTVLMAHDEAGRRWVFGTGYDPRQAMLEEFTDRRVAGMVRAAAGLPDAEVVLHPQIPGTDLTVLAFPISAGVARNYRAGRVFLAGDAAHTVPPTGGLGANTGIQDAHNLAWKLAAVLAGRAGVALLDTYHDERRPTGLLTMGQAMAHFGARMGPAEGSAVIDHGAVSMGYRYRSSAVAMASDPDPAPLLPRELAGQPGTRAPHREVTVEGREMSTLDLYGRGLVLLAGVGAAGWVSAAASLGIEAYQFGAQLAPAEAAAVHGIGASGALLVRPDGFIAWRTTDSPPDPATELAGVLNTVLSAENSGLTPA